ncbi:hypothetical protein CEE69_01945 [Rhodopirellula bahusiensis]|uniref:Uncharacterized protein n=1 Tax=Rhodopirellula bahusiensis TaxID=2014065 RepID=A0A2G1WE85_9BACT|nr:hypothetical protein CEE69_01945 [Rhodopirellula bahusiensis]
MFKVKNHEEFAEYTVLGIPGRQKARKSTFYFKTESRETLPSSKEELHDTTFCWSEPRSAFNTKGQGSSTNT